MSRPPITKAHPWTPSRGQFAGRTFTTEREYRDALAKARGHRNWYEQQRVAKKVSARTFDVLRPAQKQARARALDALAGMRRGASLTRAAKEAGTTPNTVERYVGKQLHRERGRVTASKWDLELRRMPVTTTEGAQWIDIRGSRQASLIGQHHNAVGHFLEHGDEEPLRKFKGRRVAGFELETRPEVLEELQRRGAIEFEGPLSG